MTTTEHGYIAEDLRSLAFPVANLKLLPGNPRRGDVDAVARSYERFGQRKPIVARRCDMTVIAGNHQLQAAQRLGWTHVAVVWTDDDDLTAKAFALADNRTGDLGSYENKALATLLADVAIDTELMLASGYTKADVRAFMGAVDDFVPDFQPTNDQQPRLDRRNAIICPKCLFEWRVGPNSEIEPV